MNGALKKTIQLALTLGRLIFCVARVDLFNFSPDQFSKCANAKKLIHDSDTFTVSFRVNHHGLTQLNTSVFEVTLVSSKDVVPEGSVTTLHKYVGVPTAEVIIKGPCNEIPESPSAYLLRCTITARCEIGQGYLMLTMSHLGDVYKTSEAKIPKVYPICSRGYAERQIDVYIVKIDGIEVQQDPTCSMMFIAKASHSLEFCCKDHSPNISLEIARDRENLARSMSRCVKVEAVIETKLSEFDFTTNDACGVRGRLMCQFGIETPPPTDGPANGPANASQGLLIAIAVIALVTLSSGILICIYKKQPVAPKKSIIQPIPPRKNTIVQEQKIEQVPEPVPEPEQTLANDRKRSRGSHDATTDLPPDSAKDALGEAGTGARHSRNY